jgi:hypothetical protein
MLPVDKKKFEKKKTERSMLRGLHKETAEKKRPDVRVSPVTFGAGLDETRVVSATVVERRHLEQCYQLVSVQDVLAGGREGR